MVAAFEAQGYRPRDELVAMMHAEVGFQALRVSPARRRHPVPAHAFATTGTVPTDDRAAQQALLRTRLADKGWETPAMLDLMPQAQTFYFDSVSQIRMPSWTRGRVALVGDAAACPSFLAGQGSALAMVESYTLAAELARCRRSPRGVRPLRASGSPRCCAPSRTPRQGLGLAFAPKNRLQLVVRNTVMRLMGLPKVADLVMGRSFRDAVELPTFAAA